jgi:hypothetical protein
MTNEYKVSLGLSVDEVNLVLNALAELPAKVSMSLINNISNQAQQQLGQQQRAPSVADRDDEVVN